MWPGAWSWRDHDATRRRPPGADSEEKHEPVSDIGTAAADSLKVLDLLTGRLEKKHEPVSDIGTAAAGSLKVLDPNRPIREAELETSWVSRR